MSSSSVRYERLPTEDPCQDTELEPGQQLDFEANHCNVLTPDANFGTRNDTHPRTKGFLNGLLAWHQNPVNRQHDDPFASTLIVNRPMTPLSSSDGVFTNIPAKPTSSREVDRDHEEMCADEWIFMTPEQRSKLPPPRYSKIKRDHAPSYRAEYTPPVFRNHHHHARSKRAKPLLPRVNIHPIGSSGTFIFAAALSLLLPILGFFLIYLLAPLAWWKTHAVRLGCRTGFGIGLFHIGAMIVYIPAAIPKVSQSRIPLIFGLLWTAFASIPFGWPMAKDSSKEYMWLRVQERVLLDRLVSAGLDVDSNESPEQEREDGEDENAYMYIEGTDMRVKDLKRALAKARDARLARSLRAAGF